MAQLLYLQKTEPKTAPLRVRETYQSRILRSFKFLEVTDTASAVTTIETKLVYEENDLEFEQNVTYRLVNEGPSLSSDLWK